MRGTAALTLMTFAQLVAAMAVTLQEACTNEPDPEAMLFCTRDYAFSLKICIYVTVQILIVAEAALAADSIKACKCFSRETALAAAWMCLLDPRQLTESASFNV